MQATHLDQRRTHTARIGAVVLAVQLVGTPAFATSPAIERRVAVTPEQIATVEGEFESLKKLLDELCRLGGVELRSYDPDDRAVRVEYADLPLSTVLAELLRRESYIVGINRAEGTTATRVVWLRVTGGPPGVPVAPEAEPAPPLAFEVPSSFGETSFASEDPVQRARALESVTKKLLESESGARSLLAADPTAVAGALRGYPHAGALLRQLRDDQGDPAMRAKIDAVLAEID